MKEVPRILFADELAKLSALVRSTSSNVTPNLVERINGLQDLVMVKGDSLSLKEIHSLIEPFLAVVCDPTVNGHITGEVLSCLLRLMEMGGLQNISPVSNSIIDSVTATRFTETDRATDEIVLLKIIKLLELVVAESDPLVDKSKVSSALQCIQPMWVQDSHSYVLREAAKMAVFKILKKVVLEELKVSAGSSQSYASTLLENVCLNIEIIVKQPPSLFDSEKLAFFVDVIGLVERLQYGQRFLVPFQIWNALYWLLPPGPLAAAIDNGSYGALSRPSAMGALPTVASLVSIGSSVIGRLLHDKGNHTAPLVIESLIHGMYLRNLSPLIEGESGSSLGRLNGFGESGIFLLQKRGLVGGATGTSAVSSPLESVSVQSTLLESLRHLMLIPDLVLTLWESFDCVWHRSELVSLLVDAVLSVASQSRGFPSLALDSNGDARARLMSAVSLIRLTESADPITEAGVNETLALSVLDRLLDNIAGGATVDPHVKDTTGEQFAIRSACAETCRMIKSKPKKTADFVLNFSQKFTHAGERLAKTLRLMHGIDFESLGEFFGQPSEASALALADFIKSLDLRSMDPEQALRSCLQSFRLPGEAQQIDRIVKEIAYEYYTSHSDLSVPGNFFRSADAAYTFFFSVIMLNTDQHNPQVKRRMELKDFLRNNRKINDGEDIPEDVQSRVFNSIRAAQIVTPRGGSLFCCPLKAKWRDWWHLLESGFVPNEMRAPKGHSTRRLLCSKGYDVMLVAYAVMARDPGNTTIAASIVGKLAGLAVAAGEDTLREEQQHGQEEHSIKQQGDVSKVVSATDHTKDSSAGHSGELSKDEPASDFSHVLQLSSDCVAILQRYGIECFGTAISGIRANARSYAALHQLLRLGGGGSRSGVGSISSIVSAQSVVVGLWSSYGFLESIGSSFLSQLPSSWTRVLSVPVGFDSVVTAGPPSTGQSGAFSMFRGLLGSWDSAGVGNSANHCSDQEESHGSFFHSSEYAAVVRLYEEDHVLRDNARASFLPGQPNAPSGEQLKALAEVGVVDFLKEISTTNKSNQLVQGLLSLILAPAERIRTGGDASSPAFWEKEVVRSSPWIIFVAVRVFDVNFDPSMLPLFEETIITVLNHFEQSSVLTDVRGLKLVLFSIVALGLKSPAFMTPLVERFIVLGSQKISKLTAVVCVALRELLCECSNPLPWPVLFKLLAAVSPHKGSEKLLKKIAIETVFALISNEAFCLWVNEMGDSMVDPLGECVGQVELLLSSVRGPHRVSKILTEIACNLAGRPGTQKIWTIIVARITARATVIANQKRPTGPELSDAVELLRMCLGDPRAVQFLTPDQAALTVERAANALSAIVSANTSAGALQTAISVYMRFFLALLDKLQQNAQFDNLWLTSLRVVLLFIKRGQEDESMEQLSEITTETLRNALQILIAADLLKWREDGQKEDLPESPVWWKVTWESVETFCPGMTVELVGNGIEEKVGRDEQEGEDKKECLDEKPLEEIPSSEKASIEEPSKTPLSSDTSSENSI